MPSADLDPDRRDARDPLRPLATAIAEETVPPQAWVDAWAQHGEDPANAAWRAAATAEQRLALLSALRHPDHAAAKLAARAARDASANTAADTPDVRIAADAVLACVPTIPPLAEILTAALALGVVGPLELTKRGVPGATATVTCVAAADSGGAVALVARSDGAAPRVRCLTPGANTTLSFGALVEGRPIEFELICAAGARAEVQIDHADSVWKVPIGRYRRLLVRIEVDNDALTGLLDAVLRLEAPPQAWIDVWSVDGQEPANAAWRASVSFEHRLTLLSTIRHPDRAGAEETAERAADASSCANESATLRQRRTADAVLARVPTIPSLDVVLAQALGVAALTPEVITLSRDRYTRIEATCAAAFGGTIALVVRGLSDPPCIYSIAAGMDVAIELDRPDEAATIEVEVLPSFAARGRIVVRHAQREDVVPLEGLTPRLVLRLAPAPGGS